MMGVPCQMDVISQRTCFSIFPCYVCAANSAHSERQLGSTLFRVPSCTVQYVPVGAYLVNILAEESIVILGSCAEADEEHAIARRSWQQAHKIYR